MEGAADLSAVVIAAVVIAAVAGRRASEGMWKK
jgi:hypothetical protein